MIVRLASRGSALARWQAGHVRRQIQARHPGAHVEIRILRTTGDRITDVPLARIGDKGLFTKEVDQAVLDGEADAAVHSLKDLPTHPVHGLRVGAILEREDPRDAFLPAPGRPPRLKDLPPGARVGTSSLRRRAQLLHRRPDLIVEDLRGNLDTRLARLAEHRYDAVILAAAGIHRLARTESIGELLDAPDWLPAAGQGALAITIRDQDAEMAQLVRTLEDDVARDETTAERALLASLEGGCQIPIGVLGRVVGTALELYGVVADVDGRTLVRGSVRGDRRRATELGQELADQLRSRGADAILDAVRRADPQTLPPATPP